MVTNLGQQLQSAYVSVISSVEGMPAALWKMVGDLRQITPSQAVSLVKDRASSLGETLSTLRDQVVKNLSYYILVSTFTIMFHLFTDMHFVLYCAFLSNVLPDISYRVRAFYHFVRSSMYVNPGTATHNPTLI